MRVLYKLVIRPGREPDVRKAAAQATEEKFQDWGLKGHFFMRGNKVYAYFESEDGNPIDRLREEKGAKKVWEMLVDQTSFNPDDPELHRLREWPLRGAEAEGVRA